MTAATQSMASALSSRPRAASPCGPPKLGKWQARPPTPAFASAKTIAIMQIVNIINCDMVTLTLGIITLVFLNDPEVRDHLRSKGVEI